MSEPFILEETRAAREALSITRTREADLTARLTEAMAERAAQYLAYDPADTKPSALKGVETATLRVAALEAQLSALAVERAEQEAVAVRAELEQATAEGMLAAQDFGAAGFVRAHESTLEEVARTVASARAKLEELLSDAEKFNVDADRVLAAVRRANDANVEDLKLRTPAPPRPVESEKERQRISQERFGRRNALTLDAYRDELTTQHDFAVSEWLGRILSGARELEVTAVPATRETIKTALAKRFPEIEGVIK